MSLSKSHDRQVRREAMRALDMLVDSDEDRELAGRERQQCSVLKARPTHLLHSPHLVADEFIRQFGGRTLIEQNAHWLPEPRAPAPARQ